MWSGVRTRQWTRSGNVAGDRVKLWIDNSAIIEHWTSLASPNPQGTISLRAFAYYDMWLKFKIEGSDVGQHFVDLKWKSGVSALESVRVLILLPCVRGVCCMVLWWRQSRPHQRYSWCW